MYHYIYIQRNLIKLYICGQIDTYLLPNGFAECTVVYTEIFIEACIDGNVLVCNFGNSLTAEESDVAGGIFEIKVLPSKVICEFNFIGFIFFNCAVNVFAFKFNINKRTSVTFNSYLAALLRC